LIAIYSSLSNAFGYFHTTNLQEKPDASPGKCSMDWIILNSDVPNLLEDIDPLDDLAE
jgi:hypothetical protein